MSSTTTPAQSILLNRSSIVDAGIKVTIKKGQLVFVCDPVERTRSIQVNNKKHDVARTGGSYSYSIHNGSTITITIGDEVFSEQFSFSQRKAWHIGELNI